MRFGISKLILLLVIYFAGFATAIYALAPAPQDCDREKTTLQSFVNSDEFAHRFNKALYKCVDISKQTAQKIEQFVTENFHEKWAAAKDQQPDDS